MTEFKDALKVLNNSIEYLSNGQHEDVIKWSQTLRRSLLIADKLMQEPSPKMHVLGRDLRDNNAPTNEIFKAMRDQLLREVESELVKTRNASDGEELKRDD